MEKEVKQIQLPDFYFSFQLSWLRITGIDVLKENEAVLYRIYSRLVFLFIITYILLEYIELSFHSDFDTLVIIGWYLIQHSLAMVKTGVVYKNRKEFGNLMRSFHEGFYKPDVTRGGKFEKECIYSILGQSGFGMKLYGVIIIVSWSMTLALSIKPRFTDSPEYWTLSVMPISLVDITHSPTFEIMYLYQTAAVGLICFWFYLCDCTVISVIAQTVAQLKILENCVRSMKQQVGNHDKSMNNVLRETIKHHLSLLATADKVEYLCSYLILCSFLANLILLCLVMYYTSLAPIRSFEFVQYLTYCSVVAVQLYLYCWWGNEMTLANQSLAMAIFEAYSPDDPLAYGKALRLMLLKAQKPLFFTAGKFVPLSLEAYKAIIKASFSYFTVLRKVNEK